MKAAREITITILLLFIAGSLYSKSPQDTSGSKIIITGQILDTAILNNPNYESNVIILLSKLPFTSLEIKKIPNNSYKIKYKAGDTFKVSVPNVRDMIYMHIAFTTPKYNAVSTFKTNWIDNVYMLSKGDSIFCKLKLDSHQFSGKGAEKLQCQQEIYSLKFTDLDSKYLKSEGSFLKGIGILQQKCDSIFQLQRKVIARYERTLDKRVINAMVANAVSYNYFPFYRSIDSKSANYKRSAIVKADLFDKAVLPLKNISPSDLALSPVYTSILLKKIMIDTYISENGVSDSTADMQYRIQKSYDRIDEDFTGAIRDKLIALLIVSNNANGITLLSKVLNLVQDPLYRNMLTKVLLSKARGRNYAKYSLTNIQGNQVSLSEFSNKVILLDFWFTGCVWCKKLNQVLEPIHEKFKDNPKVVFVSVSIDENFEVWNNSIQSGEYTFPGSINLYTGGRADTHPIIKENYITGYPQFYIIKNGMMYAHNPPKPKSPKDSEGVAALVQIINGAIQ